MGCGLSSAPSGPALRPKSEAAAVEVAEAVADALDLLDEQADGLRGPMDTRGLFNVVRSARRWADTPCGVYKPGGHGWCRDRRGCLMIMTIVGACRARIGGFQ